MYIFNYNIFRHIKVCMCKIPYCLYSVFSHFFCNFSCCLSWNCKCNYLDIIFFYKPF